MSAAETTRFLRAILPTEGVYVLALQQPGSKRVAHKTYDDIESMAAAALRYDERGFTVYHACCSVVSAQGVWNAQKERYQIRAIANAHSVRSQWLDIDVGEAKDYPTRAEALKALAAMCVHFEVAAPTIVSSGKGLHCYWEFASDLPVPEFRAAARNFSEALKAYGFRHDTKPTRNAVTLLRPVGTHHRKTATPLPVKILRDSKGVYEPEEFYALFGGIPNVLDAAAVMSEWGSGQATNYAPSTAKQIVKQCAALRQFGLRTHSDPPITEDYWRNMLGLLKHTVEGEKLAHRWSKSSDERYDQYETQQKIDNWEGGPPTCETVAASCAACEGCPARKKIKSPISLGKSPDLPPEPAAPAEAEQDLKVSEDKAKLLNTTLASLHSVIPNKKGTNLPFWNKRYAWDGTAMTVWVPDDDGGGEWVAFSNTLYYPFIRYETDTDTRAMMICALTDPQKNVWRIFEMPTSKAADPRTLAISLAEHEIVYMKHKQHHNQQFVQDILAGLRSSGLESKTYSSFGWHDDGFVVGDTKLTTKGEVPVFLSKRIPSELQGDFGTAGSVAGWAKAVNGVYNRPGAEPHQFFICLAAASVLVALCDSDMWHGIPGAATGEGGCGKSTVCMVGCSMFGNPSKMLVPANSEGTTMNALIQRMSTMRHLPMLLDEITGRETHELQALLFALSNGRPKKRLRSDGSEIDFGNSWDAIAYITGNLSITRMLADSDRLKADASQVRVFEVHFSQAENKRVFKGVNGKADIEGALLGQNYGVVGREFVNLVMRNKTKVTEMLQSLRGKYAAGDTDPRERFYYDVLACNMVAAKLLKSMGAIDFDLNNMRRWALEHIKAMGELRTSSLATPEDYLQEFLAYLTPHTITTLYYKDGRGKQSLEDSVVEPLREPLARHASKDRRFIVTRAAFTNWCTHPKQKLDPDWLLGQLEKQGYVGDAQESERHYLAKGTSLKSVRARCVELSYDRLDEAEISLPEIIEKDQTV